MSDHKQSHFPRTPGVAPGATWILALAAFVSVTLAGCASTGAGGAIDGNRAVVKRAEARWDAVLAGDFENAYQYYSPGFRSSHTRGDFELGMRLRKVQFREARYVEQSCEGDRCDLKFEVQYHIASPVPGLDQWQSNTTIDETWIRTQNEWWYLPDNS